MGGVCSASVRRLLPLDDAWDLWVTCINILKFWKINIDCFWRGCILDLHVVVKIIVVVELGTCIYMLCMCITIAIVVQGYLGGCLNLCSH